MWWWKVVQILIYNIVFRQINKTNKIMYLLYQSSGRKKRITKVWFEKPDCNPECVTLDTIKTGSQGKTPPALRPLPIEQMEHLTWVSG